MTVVQMRCPYCGHEWKAVEPFGKGQWPRCPEARRGPRTEHAAHKAARAVQLNPKGVVR